MTVEHSRTLMEWWPFLIFHRGGLRIKVINNSGRVGKEIDVGDGPRIGADGHVKAFGFKDPEGYTLEVFAWLDNPK